MGRPQSAWSKFKLLMWKNWTLQKRHKVQTVVELILPLVFTSLLVLIRSLADATEYPDPSIYDSYSVDHLPYNLTHRGSTNLNPEALRNISTAIFPEGLPDEFRNELFQVQTSLLSCLLFNQDPNRNCSWEKFIYIGYTPHNNFTERIMETARKRLATNTTIIPRVLTRGFDSESDMVAWLEITPSLFTKIGGVVFISPSDDGEMTKKISYKIRPHQQTVVEAFKPPSLWYTSLQFPPFQMLGPRNKHDPVGGMPGYYKTGFLALQHAVSAAVAQDIRAGEVPPARVQRVPYPGYIQDDFLLVLQGWLPLVVMLSFIYPAINICKNVVVEKEKRLKESMKMMGMPNWIHWLAWWTKSFIMLFISVIITVIMLCVDWYSGPSGIAVLSQSDPSVFLVFMVLFIITSISFCFMISVFFSKANSGATAAGVLFFILFLPYDFLFIQYDTLQLHSKLAACVMSNTAMGFGGMLIAKWEGTGDGLQWHNINEYVSPDDHFKMSHVFAMFVVDTMLYLLITWYVEAVFPGEYGIPQKWYFPFTKHYWVSSAGGAEDFKLPTNNNTERSDFFEAEPTDGKAGVQIRNLTKVFGNSTTGKVAVNQVNLNMYQGQITALLGHNGAGKTTTMSMLVGLFPASSGTAIINGYDVRTETAEVRSSLGICPQHDVLFDELTVAEHIQFFCRLKGFDGSYKSEIDKMLNVLQLEDKRHAQSQTLSGGMKRKLSVGVALCGDSKVVLLDEPTSGMDPSARRSTWDLLQRERAGRTLLLTTHFMEEADLLGDRIAIMADGSIQCCGSSLFLKRKYGAGYHMVIVKEEECVVEKITNTIRKYIPDISYDQNIGAELSYVLPNEAAPKFEEMFLELDAHREELKISSYGASITTMEEVFIRVGEQSNPKIQQELKQRSEAREGSANHSAAHGDVSAERGRQNGGYLADVENTETPTPAHATPIRPMLVNVGAARCFSDSDELEKHEQQRRKQQQQQHEPHVVVVTPHTKQHSMHGDSGLRNSGLVLFFQQMWAMMVKKAIHSFRNWILTLVQIILPVFFLTMALLVLKSFPGIADDPALNLRLENYGDTITPVWLEPGEPLAQNVSHYIGELSSSTKIVMVNTTGQANMTDYLLKLEEELTPPSFNRHYMVGLDLSSQSALRRFRGENDSTAEEFGFTVYFNNQPFHTAGTAMVVLDEVMLRHHTQDKEYTVNVVNHPSPISDETKILMQQNGQSNGFNIAFNVAFGVSFLAASFVLFLIKEASTKAKHLQFVSGVGVGVFWLSNLIWDYVNFWLPCIGMLLTLLAFQEEGFIESQTQSVLALLFAMYGYAMLPLSYLFSFLFTVPSSGFTRVTLFNIFSGMATMVTVAVLRIPVLDLVPVSDILDWVFMILPNYSLGMGMANMYSNYQGIKYCQQSFKDIDKLCELFKAFKLTNPCCKMNDNCGPTGCVEWTSNYLDVDGLGIGRVLLFMFGEGTLCLLILAMIELRVFDRIKYMCLSRSHSDSKLAALEDDSEAVLVPVTDSDVAAERTRIHSTDVARLKEDNVLVVKDLTKYYGHFQAVDRLCLGVPKGECFGLLGINGAGKTTTFKMLTGDEMISHGDAFIAGKSVKSNVKEVHKLLGYCPQFDAVIDQMTGRETLRMFARLRGIHESDIEDTVNRLAEGLFLSEHVDKQVRQYSGGNKRKLSTAVALVGEPPIVFLDEPTTGMDPVARRLLWDVICRIRAAGHSIILTSHSMEECEALCTRLAVMVNGQFKCLGSPQHLKSKFGQGYTLLIKVSVSDDEKLEFSKSHRRGQSSSSAGRQMSASVAPLQRQQSVVTPAVQMIQDFVETSFPGSVLKDVHQGLLNYQITDMSISWASIFGAIERAKHKLNIEDYSVGQTTLEQVFLNFAKAQRADETSTS